MRRFLFALSAGVLVALAVLPGCSRDSSPPRAGDTVTPVLATGLDWTAGQNGKLLVRLQAKNADGSAARLLGFDGIPTDTNPVATVTFYQGAQARPPIDVPLSHRC